MQRFPYINMHTFRCLKSLKPLQNELTETTIPGAPASTPQSSVNSHPQVREPSNKKHNFTYRKSSKKTTVATEFESAIHYELQKPLGRINLSIEILKSEIKDQDLNIYLDIIMRSSEKINKIIDELYLYKPVAGTRRRS